MARITMRKVHEAHLTQEGLAEIVDICLTRMSVIERSAKTPRLDT